MKCESCGSPLSLEQKFCPYCGKENMQATQHVQDMERYHGEFESTKSHVYGKTKSVASNAVKGVVISLLFLVIVFLFYTAVASYEVMYQIKDWSKSLHAKEYKMQIEEFLEDGDYYSLGMFCNAKGIYAYDNGYEEYRPVINMASQYAWFYNYMLNAVLHDKYWKPEDNHWVYDSMASALNQFYLSYEEDYEKSYRKGNLDMDVMRPYMDDMMDEVCLILTEYCHLTREEAMGLPYMKEAQRQLLVEERMEDAEK